MEGQFCLEEYSENERAAIQALLERKLGQNEVLWRQGPSNSAHHFHQCSIFPMFYFAGRLHGLFVVL